MCLVVTGNRCTVSNFDLVAPDWGTVVLGWGAGVEGQGTAWTPFLPLVALRSEGDQDVLMATEGVCGSEQMQSSKMKNGNLKLIQDENILFKNHIPC